MNSNQNNQLSSTNIQTQEKNENNTPFQAPNAPLLRPVESPNIEFEDFLLPEPLLGESEFLEENQEDELDAFFLDEEEDSNQVLEGTLSQIPKENFSLNTKEHICKRNVERFCSRNHNILLENEASNTLQQNFDYQMSMITDDHKCSVEGVVELIFRKKSISI